MKIKRWDEENQSYTQVTIPDDWKIKAYSVDMDEIINCVCCGKVMTFGDGYTSRRFHTEKGYGYAECGKCYFEYGG